MNTSEIVPPINELENVEGNEENLTVTTTPETTASNSTIIEDTNIINDELDNEGDVEGDVEGSFESPIQIAPTGDTNPLGDESNPMLFIQLGDRVVYDSKKHGRTIG